jgi:hypothetical protein
VEFLLGAERQLCAHHRTVVVPSFQCTLGHVPVSLHSAR